MIDDELTLQDALSTLQARDNPRGEYVTVKLTEGECEALEKLLEKLLNAPVEGTPV